MNGRQNELPGLGQHTRRGIVHSRTLPGAAPGLLWCAVGRGAQVKRTNALSKCPAYNAVANPRWPVCLACGEVLPSLKALAHRVLERNGRSVAPAPANDSPDHWDDEMTALTRWCMNTDQPLRRFELRTNVTVLDPEQYWAGLRAIIAGPPQARVPTKVLRAELRRLHQLFG